MEPEPSKGRGRGLALMQALKKSQMMDSPEESPEPSIPSTPGPSNVLTSVPSVGVPASSTVSTGTAMNSAVLGRGRLPLMLKRMREEARGPVMTPASDVSPSPSVLGSTGRGLKILQSLKAQTSPQPPGAKSEISAITEKMSQTSIATATTLKNKTNKFFVSIIA